MTKDYLTTTEVARLLGVSRITVFKKIKAGRIRAMKIGRNFVVNKRDLDGVLGEALTKDKKREIETAVKKVINEYGETLKLLGQE